MASLNLLKEKVDAHLHCITSIAFSPDGSRIVSGSDDKGIRVWDSASLSLISEKADAHIRYITSVAFSYDGSRVVSGSADKAIRVWDSASLSLLREKRDAHTRCITSIAFSPNGLVIVSGSWDKALRIWDSDTFELKSEKLDAHASYIWCVSFSAEATRLVSSSSDKAIRVWDSASLSLVKERLNAHHDQILCVAFSPDGDTVVSASADMAIRLWRSASLTLETEVIRAHHDHILSVAFSHDGARVVSGSADMAIRVWDSASLSLVSEKLNAHRSTICTVGLSPDGTRVVSGSLDKAIRVWDASDFAPLRDLTRRHEEEANSRINQALTEARNKAESAKSKEREAKRIARKVAEALEVERRARKAAEEALTAERAARRAAEEALAAEREARSAAEEACGRAVSQLEVTQQSLRAAQQEGHRQMGTLVVFSRAELESATSNFSTTEKIGEGGFGQVFRAGALISLPSTAPMAVKRLAANSKQRSNELRTEIQVLGTCRHEKLLPLMGFCLDAFLPCLVYPLMQGGSLEDRLFLSREGQARLRMLGLGTTKPISWQMRLRVIRDATRGLVYLHTPTAVKDAIVHRDVKPANILLDLQGNAKLSDVGLALEASELQKGRKHFTTRSLIGTPGFIDPLYAQTGQLSPLTDGYALGVSLLMCLAACEATAVMEVAAHVLEDPSQAQRIAEQSLNWPEDLAREVVEIARGLTRHGDAAQRMPLQQALDRLERVSELYGLRPGMTDAMEQLEARTCIICMCAPRTVRFGCGHAVCCQINGCEAAVRQRGICPNCRDPIESVADSGDHIAFQGTFLRGPQ